MFSYIVLAQPTLDRPSPARVIENEVVPRVICSNSNFNELVDTLFWQYLDGTTLASTLLPSFTATRGSAGDYKCIIRGSNQEKFSVFTLIVQCKRIAVYCCIGYDSSELVDGIVAIE